MLLLRMLFMMPYAYAADGLHMFSLFSLTPRRSRALPLDAARGCQRITTPRFSHLFHFHTPATMPRRLSAVATP